MMKVNKRELAVNSIELLKQLIEIPSFSGEENDTAALIENYLSHFKIEPKRKKNNVWAFNQNYNPAKPTILLNSHHDTVKVNSGWTYDPFKATDEDGKLIGLGSCDAGASLVSLLAAFLHFYDLKNLKYNLIFSATAEEETTGENSIRSVLPDLEPFDFAIVGEPTGMEMAIAEKGLIVLHCQANGISGHAARGNGINAITKAIEDVNWFNSYKFSKESRMLGPVRMSVTGINGGIQHNVIPDKCTFMVDIRSTDAYTNADILEVIKKSISSDIVRASDNLNPTSVPEEHILVEVAKKLGIPRFASPTMSDQAQINKPSIKMGPGLSERSHTADEFVYLSEIEQGVEKYIQLLDKIVL